jgi:hypothetical protein
MHHNFFKARSVLMLLICLIEKGVRNMKRSLGAIVVVVCCLLIVNYAYAVRIGNNVGEPRIFIFSEGGLSSYEDWVTGSPGLEVLTLEFKIADEGAGPSGLHSITISERVKVFSNSGGLLFYSPWVDLRTDDLYDPTTGELNCQAGPAYGGAPCVTPDEDTDDGFFGGGGMATYSATDYVVIGLGFRAYSDAAINGTTNHHIFWVWVVDPSTGNLVSSFRFVDNDYGIIDPTECEVKDYDSDGDDDLIISRWQDHPTKSEKEIVTIDVLDLITKARKVRFTFSIYGD